MAYYSAHSKSLAISITTLMLFSCLLVMGDTLPASTISAAPALLPDPTSPSSSPPALSPDIYPIFPTPGGSQLAPSDSSAPLIPSSPSPPNPDAFSALGPEAAFSPEGVLPDSSSDRWHVELVLSSMVMVLAAFFLNRGLVCGL